MNIFPSTILPNRTQIPWADSAWVYASVFLSHVRNESGKNCPKAVGPTWQGHWPILTCCISKGVSMCFSINTSFYVKKNISLPPNSTQNLLQLNKYSHSFFTENFCTTAQKTRFIPWKKLETDCFLLSGTHSILGILRAIQRCCLELVSKNQIFRSLMHRHKCLQITAIHLLAYIALHDMHSQHWRNLFENKVINLAWPCSSSVFLLASGEPEVPPWHYSSSFTMVQWIV